MQPSWSRPELNTLTNIFKGIVQENLESKQENRRITILEQEKENMRKEIDLLKAQLTTITEARETFTSATASSIGSSASTSKRSIVKKE